MKSWLYLHFPSLQLDGLFNDACPADRPPAVAEMAVNNNPNSNHNSNHEQGIIIVNPKDNLICQLNDAAKKQGLHPQMGLAAALTLAEQLNIIEYDQQVEITRLHELAQWLYQVVAEIVLFEPNGLALEVSSMLSLYDDIENYWQGIQQILQQQKVRYQRAIAHSPLAARLLAKDGHKPLNSNEYTIQRQLDRLPITALELDAKAIEQLHRLGIRQMQQLTGIQSKELGQRFGLALLTHLGRIKGEIRQSLTFYQPPEHFNKYLALFHEIVQSATLLFPLKRMLQDMSTFLRQRDWCVTSLTLTLHHRDSITTVLTIASAAGEYQADKWLTLTTLHIERIRLSQPVVGITLASGELLEKQATVNDLFDGNKGQLSSYQLISLLQAKVGNQRVSGIQLHADHRPEYASSYQAKTAAKTARAANSPVNKPSPATPASTTAPTIVKEQLPQLRPLILLSPPTPLTEQYQILHGPERIRSAWWDKNAIYRDYFIARNHQGALCWLFHEPQGAWFLQGYFC